MKFIPILHKFLFCENLEPILIKMSRFKKEAFGRIFKYLKKTFLEGHGHGFAKDLKALG